MIYLSLLTLNCLCAIIFTLSDIAIKSIGVLRGQEKKSITCLRVIKVRSYNTRRFQTELYCYDFASGASKTFSPTFYIKTVNKYFTQNFRRIQSICTRGACLLAYDTALISDKRIDLRYLYTDDWIRFFSRIAVVLIKHLVVICSTATTRDGDDDNNNNNTLVCAVWCRAFSPMTYTY